MSDYDYGKAERKEVVKWFWVFGLGIVLLSVLVGVLGGFGRVFGTVVDREVLTHSHQYREARLDEITTYRAQLGEVEYQLDNDIGLTDQQRNSLKAKAAGIRVLLRAAEDRNH